MALSTTSKVRFPSNVPIADKQGNPSTFFVRQLQTLLDEKADVTGQVNNNTTGVSNAQSTANAALPTAQLMSQLLADMGGDPAADKIMYFSEADKAFKFLSIGTNLSIASHTLNATGGGGGGGRVLISDQVLSANASAVTFSSIPASYSDLVLEYEARRSDANSSIEFYAQFNGDTAANYQYYTENRFGTGINYSANSLRVGTTEPNGAAAGIYSVGITTFAGYSRTDRFKTAQGRGFYQVSQFEDRPSGVWKSNAAISSMVLSNGTAGFSFAAGSRFRLYGLS